MHKSKFKQPVLIYMYGIPGSGKSFITTQLSEELGMAHVSAERLRSELFEDPRHDKTERQIITQLMQFMTEQFLRMGVSVIYDDSASRLVERKAIREMTKRLHAKDLLLWSQIDIDTAWARSRQRDRRKAEDKYASTLTPDQFKQYIRIMQNPTNEDYLVISGKHQYSVQKQRITRRLQEMGVFLPNAFDQKIAKPELVNLVSRAQAQIGRVDYSRRNISIQ